MAKRTVKQVVENEHQLKLHTRKVPSSFLFFLLPVALWLLVRPLLDPLPPLPALHASLGFAIIAFLLVVYIVPVVGKNFVLAGLYGKDLLKLDDTPMCVQSIYQYRVEN